VKERGEKKKGGKGIKMGDKIRSKSKENRTGNLNWAEGDLAGT